MANPSVTIIIVNYNGKDFTKNCISSVMKTDYNEFDIIVIDNFSTDGSIEMLMNEAKENSRLKIIQNHKNVGAFRARNTGLLNSKSKYVVFLDNDTEVDPLWLKEAVKTMEADELVGVAQSKLLRNDKRKLDGCGHFLTPFGFVYEIGVGEIDEGQYDSIKTIFGAKSAAIIVRREIIGAVGLFDEEFFMAWGETDFCWKVWLAGYKVHFVSKSKVYHFRGGSISATPFAIRVYQGTKNGLITSIKNLGFKNLVLILPLYLASNFLLMTYFIKKRKVEYSKAIINGILWNLKDLRKILEKRSYVQRYIRKVKDKELEPFMMPIKSLGFFYSKGKTWLNEIR